MKNQAIARIQEEISEHIHDMLDLFRPVRITVIARSPGKPERDVLITTEDGDAGLVEVQALVHRRIVVGETPIGEQAQVSYEEAKKQ
jgi:hypothetical protein